MKRYLNVNIPKAVKQFEVALRRTVAARVIGHYRSVFRGHGLEFDSYRAYTSLDDAKMIDWKASRRANQLLIKEYVEERNVNVIFLVDVSNSMVFGSSPKLKNEYSVEMIAALANVILGFGDKVGLALFNDKLVKVCPPESGAKALFIIRKVLTDPYLYGGDFDLAHALRLLTGFVESGLTTVIIVSDFIGPRNWLDVLKILDKRCETICILVSDPRDYSMPSEAAEIVVEDPFSKKTILIDPLLIKERYEEYARHQFHEIEELFLDARCDYVRLSTDKSFILPMINFFKWRAGKWR